MNWVGKCHSNSEVTSKDKEWRLLLFCLAQLGRSFPAPFKMVTVAESSVPRACLTSVFQCRGKQTRLACFAVSQIAFSKDGLHGASGGFLRAQTTETVWESVLQSPEQFRNYFSCSQFRSKTKTPSRDKQTHASVYLFLKEKHSSAPDFLFFFFWIFLIKKKKKDMAILKFLPLKYHTFAHLHKPKAFE